MVYFYINLCYNKQSIGNCRIMGDKMDSFYNVKEIGDRIKQKRLDMQYTREKLANIAGISDKFLYDIEIGNKGMSAETLYKISKALDISADWILNSAN